MRSYRIVWDIYLFRRFKALSFVPDHPQATAPLLFPVVSERSSILVEVVSERPSPTNFLPASSYIATFSHIEPFGIMYRSLIFLCLSLAFSLLHGQYVETYYEDGSIQSRTPLNAAGEFEGLGQEFYRDGTVAAEVPYLAGKVHGIVKELYPEGHVKLKHSFSHGEKNGRMYLFRPDGTLQMTAWMQGDSTVFSQQFNTRGRLVAEKVGYFEEAIDTTGMGKPIVWLAEGTRLKANEPNLAQIFIHGLPTEFIQYTCTGGTIEPSGRADFPLIIIPEGTSGSLTLYLGLKLHSRAQAGELKKLVLEVE